MTGKVLRLVSERGFGFIRQDTGGKDLFFHASKVEPKSAFADLKDGDKVEFEIGQSDRGPVAEKVRRI